MKVLYYDCFCGISGDMNLGALIDLGVDKEYLIRELSKLNLNSEYEIEIKKSIKKGISGTKVDVILKEQHSHNHENYHYHDEHSHHRNLKDIETIINTSDLSEKIKKLSLNIFMRIAQAEAEVHGTSIYEVHFHEVGAVDSIIDIVGAAVGLDYLKVDKIIASPVQVGGGFVKCAHGLIPVPAPATVNILKDIPVKSGIVSFETTTPTGAAILAENVTKFSNKMEFLVDKIGYGIGNRDLEIPNVLRVYLGKEKKHEEIEKQYVLETNIDDMNPEFYSYVEERLFDKGALDVFKTPIIMKKGRPAIKLSILVDEKNEKGVMEVIFKETTSIGIRKFEVEKVMLHRDFLKVKTQYGYINVKNSYYQGELIKYKPEYEDCKAIAKQNNIPIREVYREIQKVMEENDIYS
ncbi:nickel pincer cofactor biosynthesis protein LarC [Clostridium sp. WILCCON 0269]|uniref:Pyridinium-3,5-bisthiocarboxylic acid mononucleotide nickel insertion protein n=1 Tax=Candidatus Clostridium eludens TaxID=3381663 RepID=A0ABW8SMF3_9CLOT